MNRTPEVRVSRRHPRFTLLTLLVLVTAIAVALGLFTPEWHRAHRKRQVAGEVRRIGGHVTFGLPQEATGVISGWLHVVLGDEYFAEAIHVSLTPRSEEDLELLRAFPELPSLTLAGSSVTDSALESLTGLVQLRGLQLKCAAISERGLQSLKELPAPDFLSFANCSLFDGNGALRMQWLTELPKVRSLEFTTLWPKDDMLKALHDARSLVDLYLDGANVTEAEILAMRDANPALSIHLGRKKVQIGPLWISQNYFPSVQDLPRVTELAFRGPRTSDATLAVLKDARCLTSLRLDMCRISNEGLNNLRGLGQLARFELVGTNITETRLSRLHGYSELSGLARTDCLVTDCGLESISHLDALTDLVVYSCQITDDGMQYLVPLKNLTSLWLGSPSITDEGLRHLQGLTKLRYLDIPAANIEGHGLKWLPASIARLDLDFTKFTDEGLAHIVERLPSLANLSIVRTHITDDGVRHLARMTALRGLNAAGTSISNDGVAELRRALPSCNIIR